LQGATLHNLHATRISKIKNGKPKPAISRILSDPAGIGGTRRSFICPWNYFQGSSELLFTPQNAGLVLAPSRSFAVALPGLRRGIILTISRQEPWLFLTKASLFASRARTALRRSRQAAFNR